MTKPIVTTEEFADTEHLADFETCYHCDFKQEYHPNWQNCAIKLVLIEYRGRHGAVVIIMECPECFEKMWIHVDFNVFYNDDNNWSDIWCEKVNEEYKRRNQHAMDEFERSLCKTCSNLEEPPEEFTTHGWIECGIRDYGSRPVMFEDTVDNFKPDIVGCKDYKKKRKK